MNAALVWGLNGPSGVAIVASASRASALQRINTGVSLVADKPVEGLPSISSKEGLAKCWG